MCRTCAHSFMEFETGSDRHHRPFVCQRFTMRSIESVYINNARRGCYFYCRHNSMYTQKRVFLRRHPITSFIRVSEHLRQFEIFCLSPELRGGCSIRMFVKTTLVIGISVSFKKKKRECLLLCGCCFYFKCRHRRCSYREYRERADQIPA